MAAEAGARLLKDANIAADEIGMLVVVTQTPDYCLPHVSAMVQNRLGLSQSTACFDIGLGCSGYIYGLATVTALMDAQGIDHAILITADTYSKLTSPSDRATAPLFGDAATATLLGKDPEYTLGRVTFGTDGGRSTSLIARGSAVRRDVTEPLYMNGPEIFSMVMAEVPKDIDTCLDLNNKNKDDIDAWVFHQANAYMLKMLRSQLGVASDKVLVDLADVGNTTSSTIPIVLERQILSAPDKPENVFLSGFGVGLSWASTVITANKEVVA
jgi:3-oxoacyl-[acyl-carrier-protein] synthase III